ncbi:hypothetical protein, partial [Amycolatopsis sp. H20-H5]|uniref:hypothetical protein n=1 Tax=Amycolatopsis sp. H20-H5 TaxID=3046309 RepID=UPI002DBF6748
VVAAVALAGLIAGLAVAFAPEPGDGRPERFAGMAARLAVAVTCATAFGLYVVPAQPGPAAAGLLVVVAAADLGGVRLPDLAARWVTAVLLVAAVVLVVLCFAIAPVTPSAGWTVPNLPGLALATLVLIPFLLPRGQDRPRLRTGALLVVALAVAIAALHQLGPVRLGLSATSFEDVLAAADAAVLLPLLTVVVVLATVPAALDAFTEARARISPERGWVTVVCGLVAAALAAFAGPVAALIAAGLCAVVELLLRHLAPRYGERRD